MRGGRILLRALGGLAALAAVGAAAFALSPAARFAAVNVPFLWFAGAVAPDIPFGAAGQRLDVYAPRHAAGAPVAVFFYGGGWRSGAREDYRFMGVTLAERGFVAVIPDYRKHPEVRFPAFIEDGAAAVAWTRERIAEHGGDPDRLFLIGHSAGAHLAALLASDPRYLAVEGVAPQAIRAVAGLAGPYHFTPQARHLIEIFGPPERFPEMQVGRFVDGDEPPMLLAHGLEDRVVGRRNLARMEAAFAATGGCLKSIRYPGFDHVDVVSAFTWLYRDSRPVLSDVTGFFADAEAAACPR